MKKIHNAAYFTEGQNEEKLIQVLKDYPSVNNVITIPQVKTIEEELVYSTDIKAITELLPSSSVKAFKSGFNRMADSNLAAKLKDHDFNIKNLWSRRPEGKFADFYSDTTILKIDN